MAKGRKKGAPVKRRNCHQKVADAGTHSAVDLEQQCEYQHETTPKQQKLPDGRQKCEYQSEGLDSPSVEQCNFSRGLANFKDKLAMLDIKEQHIRTLLGTQFNEESFFLYKQDIINEAIRTLHLTTKEKFDIPEIESSALFSSSNGPSRQFSQEVVDEIKDKFIQASLSLKCNEDKLLLTFGEIGRGDYVDKFITRMIVKEMEKWDIDEAQMSEIVQEANREYLYLISFEYTDQVFEDDPNRKNKTEFVHEGSRESLGELYAETLQPQSQHQMSEIVQGTTSNVDITVHNNNCV